MPTSPTPADLRVRQRRRGAGFLDTLPLVRAGLITFELVPLAPYPGLARLFEKIRIEPPAAKDAECERNALHPHDTGMP